MRRVSVFLTAAAFFLALANFSPKASRDLPSLFPIKQLDKWGFIDQTGKLVIPPRSVNAGNFSEELAAVGVCSGRVTLTGAASFSGRPPALVTAGVSH
jgi:hypothetical protein